MPFASESRSFGREEILPDSGHISGFETQSEFEKIDHLGACRELAF